MAELESDKRYDMEERTLAFARRVRMFVRMLTRNVLNVGDIGQLLASSGSVGANYIEANESLSKKDFVMRVKISRKEAKESRYWLDLLQTDGATEAEKERLALRQEAIELMKILGAILRKSE